MENDIIKKIVSIHDLTGFGRCGLSVATPILSAMGHQVCPLPTAILSTHPGGFQDYHFKDLTEETGLILKHWESLPIAVDCVYTGYFASTGQITAVCEFIHSLPLHNTLIVIDPVMGDHGKLYRIVADDMLSAMRGLVQTADIITPNITEAAFLLNHSHVSATYTYKEIKEMAKSLAHFSKASVVITGIPLNDRLSANILFHEEEFEYWTYQPVPQQYPGSGDIFTSLLTGKIMSGSSVNSAFQWAGDKSCHMIQETYNAGTPAREGIQVENHFRFSSE